MIEQLLQNSSPYTQNPYNQNQPVTGQFPDPLVDDFDIPKKSRKWIFAVVPLIIIILLSVGGGVYVSKTYSSEKLELSQNSGQIVTRLDEIDSKFLDLKKLDDSGSGDSASQDGTSVLGDTINNFDEIYYFNDIDKLAPEMKESVLGLEDSPYVKAIRGAKFVHSDLKKLYKDLSKDTHELKENYDTSRFLTLFKKSLSPPVDETLAYAENGINESQYTIQMYDLAIDYTGWTFDVVVTVYETLTRGADDYSIRKLENIINKSAEYKLKAQEIDSSKINEQLRDDHQKMIDDFSSEYGFVSLLYQLLEAFKKKDLAEIEKSLTSIDALVVSETEKSGLDSAMIFDNKKQELADLKSKWSDFETKLKN